MIRDPLPHSPSPFSAVKNAQREGFMLTLTDVALPATLFLALVYGVLFAIQPCWQLGLAVGQAVPTTLLVLVTRRLAKRGKGQLGAAILVPYLLITSALLSVILGIFPAMAAACAGFIVIVSLVLGPTGGYVVAGISALLWLAVFAIGTFNPGLPPPPMPKTVNMILVVSITEAAFLFAAYASQVTTKGLWKALDEATAELVRANRQLEALSRVRDEFITNVSHELRTPIASLKMYQRLLATRPDKHKQYLDVLERETDRLHNILEGLLRLSLLDQEQVVLNLTAVDLNALAGQYVADRASLAESKGLGLTFAGQPDLPPAQADPELMGQVLGILLTNALNYTPAGGQITVQTAVCAHPQGADGQPWVGFRVDDSGPGILPEEQSQVFERFYRGTVGQESGEPGTGLGLAIASEIVKRHQGRIEVASEGRPGEGATFSVWLPLAEEDEKG